MKKYARTKSGAIWELVDGVYKKPGVANYVNPDSDSIVATDDNIRNLIMPGDLIRFMAGHARTIRQEEMLELEDGHISPLLKICEIYTQCAPKMDFVLQAFDHNGLWIVK